MLQSRSAEKKEIRDSLFVFSDNGKKPAMAGHDFPFFFIRLKSRFCHAPRISASIGRDFSAHLPAHPCQVRPGRQPDRDFGKSRKLTQDSTCPGKGFHFLRRKTAHLRRVALPFIKIRSAAKRFLHRRHICEEKMSARPQHTIHFPHHKRSIYNMMKRKVKHHKAERILRKRQDFSGAGNQFDVSDTRFPPFRI